MPVHNAMTGTELHESKGIDTATNRQVAVANGAGSQTFQTMCRVGWSNYGDVTTQTTPIALTAAGTWYDMTNDGAGAQSDSTHELPEVTNIFNVATGAFDFSELAIGDTVDIRVDFAVTTAGANHEIEVKLNMDTAPIAANFPLDIHRENFKAASTDASIVRYYSLFIGSAAVRDGVHKLQMKSDGTGDTVKVNGWFVRAIKNTSY